MAAGSAAAARSRALGAGSGEPGAIPSAPLAAEAPQPHSAPRALSLPDTPPRLICIVGVWPTNGRAARGGRGSGAGLWGLPEERERPGVPPCPTPKRAWGQRHRPPRAEPIPPDPLKHRAA